VSRQKVKLSNERWFFEVPYQAKERNEASHKRLAMPFKEEERINYTISSNAGQV